MTRSFPMVAKTVSGLEQALADELQILGAEQGKVLNRAVSFTGDEATLYRVNYCSRLALRVLVPFARIRAGNEEELYRSVREIDWPSVFGLRQTFAIETVLGRSGFRHSHYVSQLAKDAIADRFRAASGRRPDVDPDRPDFRIHLHLSEDHAEISFDASGVSLHKRGYRVNVHQAPLSEVLAAGMLSLSGWHGTSPFVDPMCGSGTLLVEALMLACHIPAGYFREDFGFMHWNDFNRGLWKQVKEEADASIIRDPDLEVSGSDIDAKSIRQARQNLTRTGFDRLIRLEQLDFREARPPGPGGVLITNPPYGERIAVDDIGGLYRDLGDLFKRHFAGYRAWVLSSDLRAIKLIGLRPARRYTVFNGPLECRFYGFDLYEGSKHKPA